MNKMLSVFAILVLLIGLPFAYAQSGDSQGGVVADQTETQDLGPASQKIIGDATTYLKEKLGTDYYNQYITFQSGESFMDCSVSGCVVRNEITFDYDIPFETAGNPSFGPGPRIQITLDDNGDIVRYEGPMKPYYFTISEDRAIELAKDYGLVDITDAGVASSVVGINGYEVVWVVSSNDILRYGEVANEPIYKGIYLDVDSGEVVGEYSINPMIQTPGGSGAVELGNFFEEDNFSIQDSENMNLWVIALIVLAVLIVCFVVYRVHKK